MSYSGYNPNISSMMLSENGYTSWYDECSCCPYGYHIDLDFVRYCESISKEDKNRTGSIKRGKDRRKQRQSMEMLLGLTAPVLTVLDKAYNNMKYSQEPRRILPNQTAQSPRCNLRLNDDFDDAVSDFEKTLQRSKSKLCCNLPDVTAVSENLRRVPSISSVSSVSGSVVALQNSEDGHLKTDFDAVSFESSGLSPVALQNIREALALSLERTKELEYQVKLIPELQDELTHLRKENRHLSLRLKSEETVKPKNSSFIQISNQPNRKMSQSLTDVENYNDSVNKKESPHFPPQKDFGVMCGVLTRNIGVGHQYPNTKHASTFTTEFADKWMSEKTKFLNFQPPGSPRNSVARGTQTIIVKEKRDMGIQTSILEAKKTTMIRYTQTDSLKKPTVSHVASLAIPQKLDVGIQNIVVCSSVGSSDDTLNDVICEKCKAIKTSVGVGPDKIENVPTSVVSLAGLTNRSKSFNLVNEKLDLQKRTRTVATQYENNLSIISRACQVDIKTSSKFSQHEIKLAEKSTQHENNRTSKNTDTSDLIFKNSIGCEAIQSAPNTVDRGSNTNNEEKEVSEEKMCSKCSSKKMETSSEFKKDILSSPTFSRIPIPTTPIEARKFRRQDTYTKVYSTSPTDESPVEFFKLSGLDLSPKDLSTELVTSFEKAKPNICFDVPASTSNSQSQNGVNLISGTKVQVEERTLPVSGSTIFQPSAQNRKKAIPSKEMQGAMKVLNDSIQKSPTGTVKNQSAVNIVRQEWFKISSLVTANPLDVEDYLDAFEDMSSQLLQYVVNMTDSSGNTAMHYAVSHGNFDVVSILLDSKVCDINKPNKAGYTSVMLVSLAEVRSQTHANVVGRLFQLADVNIRASQHGQTALMLAVSHGRLDMVKMLLDAGADINIQDEDGSTALMCAAEHGHIEIIKHFLNQPDCDSTITDVDGSTALKIAMDAGHRHIGVLLYAHERNFQKSHPTKLRKSKSNSPKTSSPLPIRSSHRALTDNKK